jgi:hypothetical protein
LKAPTDFLKPLGNFKCASFEWLDYFLLAFIRTEVSEGIEPAVEVRGLAGRGQRRPPAPEPGKIGWRLVKQVQLAYRFLERSAAFRKGPRDVRVAAVAVGQADVMDMAKPGIEAKPDMTS